MNTNFARALPLFLAHEGGFVNHPNDPGGATNKGVTIANFRKYVKPGGTVSDLKKITNAQVATVFKRHYWDRVRADELPSGVDYTVGDFAINSGPSRAIKELQKVVGVVVDGAMGPLTMAAVNNADPIFIIRNLNANRLAFMKRIRNGSLWKTFGKGWQRRVDEVERKSLQWAGEQKTEQVKRTIPPVIDAPAIPQMPEGLDKPMLKSKTNWLTKLLSGIGVVGSFFVGLDPIIQALLILVIVGAAGYVIYERKRYRDEARAIKDAS